MALQVYTAEEFDIAPLESKKRVKTKEQEAETDELEQWERGTRMQPNIDAECQTELVEVDEAEIDLSDFIHRVAPIMLDQLAKTTRAFQCKDYPSLRGHLGGREPTQPTASYAPSARSRRGTYDYHQRRRLLCRRR